MWYGVVSVAEVIQGGASSVWTSGKLSAGWAGGGSGPPFFTSSTHLLSSNIFLPSPYLTFLKHFPQTFFSPLLILLSWNIFLLLFLRTFSYFNFPSARYVLKRSHCLREKKIMKSFSQSRSSCPLKPFHHQPDLKCFKKLLRPLLDIYVWHLSTRKEICELNSFKYTKAMRFHSRHIKGKRGWCTLSTRVKIYKLKRSPHANWRTHKFGIFHWVQIKWNLQIKMSINNLNWTKYSTIERISFFSFLYLN